MRRSLAQLHAMLQTSHFCDAIIITLFITICLAINRNRNEGRNRLRSLKCYIGRVDAI